MLPLPVTPMGHDRSIRQTNRMVILSLLRQYGPCSRKEIAERTGLSQPSVSVIVRELLHDDLVREVGRGASSGGRRPVLVDINPSAHYVLGVILESDRIACAVADLSGRMVATDTIEVSTRSGDGALTLLTRVLKEVMNRSNLPSDRLLGIGVGVPGIVRPESGRVRRAPGVGWWTDVAVRDWLEKHLGIPTVVENDVNLMALGEFAQGAGRGARCLVLMYVGTGIGAGIVVEGRLFRGATNAAGEIGYLPLGPEVERIAGETGFGVFEQQFSARAVAQFLDQQGWNPGPRPVAELLRAAKERPIMREYLEWLIRSWAYGIATVVSVLDPDCVLLAGDAADIGDEGVAKVRSMLTRILPEVPTIQLAELGERAGLVGAVHVVLNNQAGYRHSSVH